MFPLIWSLVEGFTSVGRASVLQRLVSPIIEFDHAACSTAYANPSFTSD